MFSKKAVAWLLILSCVLVAVTLPRFDRRDPGALKSLTSPGTTDKMADAAEYAAITSYFRGKAPLSATHSPWTYRPLVPFMASFLPCPPVTAIDLINEASLIGALWFLYALMAGLGLVFSARIFGCALFAVSFPVFYYGAVGYIDPPLILFFAAGTCLIFTQRWLAFSLATVLASGIKESAGMLLIVACVYLAARGELFRKKALLIPLTAILYLIAYRLFHVWIPGRESYGWPPSLAMTRFNVVRPRSWISFALTFGAPGTLVLFSWRHVKARYLHEKGPEIAALYTGFAAALALWVYAMISSSADGRTAWSCYPFAIPLAAITLEGFLGRRKETPAP